MRNGIINKTFPGITAILLAAVLLFSLSACKNNEKSSSESGEKTEFTLIVEDENGKETSFSVKTDKETVGDALEEKGIIAGEKSSYGLFVKTVNGITADYDKDGVYWAFYIDGEYAMTGVSSTPITPGKIYKLKIEKAQG